MICQVLRDPSAPGRELSLEKFRALMDGTFSPRTAPPQRCPRLSVWG